MYANTKLVVLFILLRQRHSHYIIMAIVLLEILIFVVNTIIHCFRRPSTLNNRISVNDDKGK